MTGAPEPLDPFSGDPDDPGDWAVIIGAGVAGLTAGALLAQAGHEVTVLEAHVDPGGCAATFSPREKVGLAGSDSDS